MKKALVAGVIAAACLILGSCAADDMLPFQASSQREILRQLSRKKRKSPIILKRQRITIRRRIIQCQTELLELLRERLRMLRRIMPVLRIVK